MNEIKISPTSNRETYEESWSAMDENGDEIDLTGATIVFEVRDPQSRSPSLSASTGDGITIATTVFTVRFEVASMRDLCAKDYDVGCTIELNGDTTQFFVGKFPVVDGVVS